MEPIRVLIADDSVTMRSALKALLGRETDLTVVGEAADGAEAVRLAKSLRPDVITMDVQMPGLNGLEATEAIMSEAACPIVVVCAVSDGRQVDISMRAMAVGALELIAKPAGGGEPELRKFGQKVADAVRLLSRVKVITRRVQVGAARAVAGPSPGQGMVVGMVASTGGPAALATVLSQLPAAFPAPILVAQHITLGFAGGLARYLSSVGLPEVMLAQAGVAPRAGAVYLAPDGLDLTLDGSGRLATPPPLGKFAPSGNRLLSSIAAACGRQAVGMVLTGMGEDGAQGLLEMYRAGGVTFAQDQASSIVYGMPEVARRLGGAGLVLPLSEMATALCRVVSRAEAE